LDAETGDMIWSYTTGRLVHSSPAVANGKIYIGSYDSKIYCFGEPDFAISVDPVKGSVDRGKSISAIVTVSVIGFENVLLSVEGAPSDAIVEFDPPSGERTFISTMTISTSSNTPTGEYALTISGTGARGKVRTATYALTVAGPYGWLTSIDWVLILLVVALITLGIWAYSRKRKKKHWAPLLYPIFLIIVAILMRVLKIVGLFKWTIYMDWFLVLIVIVIISAVWAVHRGRERKRGYRILSPTGKERMNYRSPVKFLQRVHIFSGPSAASAL
jgi:hypothetical protein